MKAIETPKVALVGVGYWGPNILRNLCAADPECVSWVCDKNETRLAHLREHYPDLRMTTDFNQVLADPETHAVALALPPALQHSMALQALAAGKHLFVEKPVALSEKAVREVVDAARHADRFLMAGLIYRYNPMIDRIRELIRAGSLGKIIRFYSRRTGLNLRKKSGNILWMLAPHDLSILTHWFDETIRIRRVSARRVEHRRYEDQAHAQLDLEGMRADIYMSWLDPVKTRRLVVVGTQGVLVYDECAAPRVVKLYRCAATDLGIDASIDELERFVHGLDAPQELIHADGDSAEPLANEMKHFLHCLRNGQTPLTNGREALAITELIETMENSLLRVACPKTAAGA